MDAIRVENLTKTFKDVTAVDRVSFSVPEGELFGLLGPNGAGKTTTINVLSTLLHPTSGKAEVAGHDVAANRNEVRKAIGSPRPAASSCGASTCTNPASRTFFSISRAAPSASAKPASATATG